MVRTLKRKKCKSYRKLLFINLRPIHLRKEVSGGLIHVEISERARYNRNSGADQNTFCTYCFLINLENVIITRVHFNDYWRGLIIGCMFFFTVFTGRRAYSGGGGAVTDPDLQIRGGTRSSSP